MFSSIAWAQAATPTAGPTLLENLFPYIILIGIFYFLVIRPQQRRSLEQQKTREALKRGDAVLTTGGIRGTIEGLTQYYVTLEIATGVKIKVLKSAIAGLASDDLEKSK